MLRASGFFDLLCGILSPVCAPLGIPAEIIPLALIKPVSGSGASAVLVSILDQYGADSRIGRIASVMAGSTETTFYAVTVYFGSVGMKRSGYAIPAALFADLVVIALAIITIN